jgi:hypothetical protein
MDLIFSATQSLPLTNFRTSNLSIPLEAVMADQYMVNRTESINPELAFCKDDLEIFYSQKHSADKQIIAEANLVKDIAQMTVRFCHIEFIIFLALQLPLEQECLNDDMEGKSVYIEICFKPDAGIVYPLSSNE